MTSPSPPRHDGFTLIETIIYIALVSLLFAGFISFAYASRESDLQLLDKIDAAETSS